MRVQTGTYELSTCCWDYFTDKKPRSQINSLPCRLKKTASTNGGGNRSAGESGVYDMTDMFTLSDSG